MTIQQEIASRAEYLNDSDANLILMLIDKIYQSENVDIDIKGPTYHHAKVGLFDGTPSISDGYDFDELNDTIADLFGADQ